MVCCEVMDRLGWDGMAKDGKGWLSIGAYRREDGIGWDRIKQNRGVYE